MTEPKRGRWALAGQALQAAGRAGVERPGMQSSTAGRTGRAGSWAVGARGRARGARGRARQAARRAGVGLPGVQSNTAGRTGRAGSWAAGARGKARGARGKAWQARGRVRQARGLALGSALGALGLFFTWFDSVIFLSQFLDIVRESGL